MRKPSLTLQGGVSSSYCYSEKRYPFSHRERQAQRRRALMTLMVGSGWILSLAATLITKNSSQRMSTQIQLTLLNTNKSQQIPIILSLDHPIQISPSLGTSSSSGVATCERKILRSVNREPIWYNLDRQTCRKKPFTFLPEEATLTAPKKKT